MHEEEKVVPITRGKPSRLELTLIPGAASIHVQLQPVKTRPLGTASGRSSDLTTAPSGNCS